MLLKLANAFNRAFFLGSTGLTPTLTVSKNGNAFAAAAGTVSEIGDGWYKVALEVSDVDTLGALAYHFSAGTPADFLDQVVEGLPVAVQDANVVLWRSSLPEVASSGLIPARVVTAGAGSIVEGAIVAAECKRIFEAIALTEEYAADGATATPGQLLYMIFSALTEFAIAGATLVCKKLDGTTTSMQFALSPAGNPTARSRSA